MNIKNMFKVISEISKKTKKLKLFLLLDIIYCGIKYGAGYYDYQEFEFYLLNKNERETYLTRLKNNEIVRRYNDKDYFYKFDDKVIFNEEFIEYIKREYFVIDGDNFKEFEKFVKNNNKLIVKPIIGEGGFGIEKQIITSKTNLKKLYSSLIDKKQFLIEECLEQHKDINKLYNNSVNTLRLFTFYDNKKTYVVNSIFKIGNGGITVNFSSGSMYTFVNDKGLVIVPAIDQNDNVYSKHPLTNESIIGFNVPMYKEACELVKNAAKVVKEVKYIGWDVAITPKGPAIIEGNSFPGIFQIKPSFGLKKEGLIPKYQKIMKIK